MASIWAELKRRKVVRVAVAYAIVGWILIEVSSTVFPIVQLPDWTITFVTMLLLLGFPVAMILSWAYDLTPQGIERTGPATQSEPANHASGRKFDFFIIGVLVLAVGFLLINDYLPQDSDPEAVVQEALVDIQPLPAVQTPIPQEEERVALPNSVAVLPFDNLSPDPDDAYFAAGLHEEILSQLARLGNISVISRTSVLRYADTDLSIPEIARELNVETVMEGSVRYADDRVRITTQLIDAVTDEHLWAESYELDFMDIFSIQANIAMNVASALEAEFSEEDQRAMERRPTSSPAAYRLYLRSRRADSATAQSLLDRAIELDPDFALAYARKGSRYAVSLLAGDTRVDERENLEQMAHNNVERALEIDPTSGLAPAAQARIDQYHWRWAEAEHAFERAYQLEPNDADVLIDYAFFSSHMGIHTDAIELAQRAVEIDPNNLRSYLCLGSVLGNAGNFEAAAAALRELIRMNSPIPLGHLRLGHMESVLGNSDEAFKPLSNH